MLKMNLTIMRGREFRIPYEAELEDWRELEEGMFIILCRWPHPYHGEKLVTWLYVEEDKWPSGGRYFEFKTEAAEAQLDFMVRYTSSDPCFVKPLTIEGSEDRFRVHN